MRNIGKEIEKKLNFIGIFSAEELIEVGSKDAFLRLKINHPNLCAVHLYALQGAIDDIEYNRLTDEIKDDLKAFCNNL